MSWHKLIRQSHRWLSITFTVTVAVCFVALSGILPFWVFYVPLLPLFLLMATGLYMFVLPYATRRRSGRRAVLES
jgi:cellulose synthase/poly-beta-1,6-N-acetylglucosamine synthase-like glycosyltransferase